MNKKFEKKDEKIINSRHLIAKLLLEAIDDKNILINFNQANTKDKAFVQNMVYGSLRHLPALEIILNTLIKKQLKGKIRLTYTLLLQALFQLIYLNNKAEHATVYETVDVAKSLFGQSIASLTNAILRNFLRNKEKLTIKIKDHHLHQQWFVDYLKKNYPTDIVKHIINNNNLQPPMWLRINTNLISITNFLSLLKEKKIQYKQHSTLLQSIQIKNPIQVEEIPGFKQGFFYVQDLHAQLAGYILNINDNDTVLDCCAAPGGKTTHLFEINNKIKITAIDVSEKRLANMQQNLQRLKILPNNRQQIKLINLDARHTNKLQEKFDVIVLDVPCSASGVIRRHPENKWQKQNINEFKDLQEKQYQILNNNSKLIKDKGLLLYITCSIFSNENQQIIKKFLQENKNFTLIDLNNFAKKHQLNYYSDNKIGLQLLPTVNSGDGFFYALLTKK